MAGSYTRRINLYINGKEVKNDIASIKSAMSKLVNEQARMTYGSEKYVAAGKKIRALNGIIAEHKASLRGVSSSWNFESISQGLNKYFLAVSTFVAGMGSMLYAGKKAITMFAEFDDKVADVMKTTDLSKDAVYAMNEELKKLDTRTAQDELLNLGRIGGKLGLKLEKDVEGFIRASDKVVVALKEDLGGNAEEAVNQIGKLVSVFGVREEFGIEESILKTGSAINELGMASTANEGYIVEFTKRVAGIAPNAKISIQDVMGLAATLDHFGQTSEVSSTAYSQVITGMFKNTSVFAKAAKMDLGEFTALMNRDANEAFVQLLEGLNNNDAGMSELISSMGDLDLEGKRAISVIGVLSKQTGFLREQQELSNREFAKGTSLQNEFNIKNNSAQAILEKKRKELNNLAIDLGKKLMPVLTASTSGFSYFVKAFTVIADFAIRNSSALITLTTTVVAYTVATKIATMWENRKTEATLAQMIITKRKAIVDGIAIGATQLYAAATMLLTGNIKGATQAMRVFSAVTKLTPWGFVVGALALVTGGLISYISKTKEATVEQEALATVTRRANEMYDDQTAKIKMLIERIEAENVSNNLRVEAINELSDIMPGYNAQLTDEGKLINHNTELIKNYLLMLEMKYRKQAAEEEQLVLLKKEMTAKRELDKAEKDYQRTLADNQSGVVFGGDAGVAGQLARSQTLIRSNNRLESAKKEHEQTLQALETMRGEVEKAVLDYQKSMNEGIPMGPPEFDYNNLNKPPPTPPAGDSGKSKWSLNADINFLRESLKLKQDYASGVIQTEEDLNEKLRALEVQTLKDRINSGKEKGSELLDLQTQLADKYVDIQKDRMKREDSLQEEINKGMSPIEKENQEYEERLISLKLYGKQREDMTAVELAAIEALEREHQTKLSKLDAEAMKDEIDKRQQTFETGLNEMKLQHTNELNAITTLDQAKKILSATMSNEELAKVKSLNKAKKLIQEQSAVEEERFAREHLEELLDTLQTVMGSGEWEGLNLSDSLLSEEEKEALITRINELLKELAKLRKGSEETDAPKELIGGKTDILGFSQEDWDLFFKNLKDGGGGIGELLMGVKALGQIWSAYYDMINAKEKSQFDQYEKDVNAKKETLQQNLDGNLISQEAYTQQVGQLDEQLNTRKAKMERDQARRTRNIAMMEAIVNTASAVTSALKVAPPLGFVLAGLVGAMGLLQIGKIANTSVAGMEDGGYLDVTRQQDGKRFRAKNQPGKRGYVSSPTVITGEKSGFPEYIVPDQGVSNPTVKPVLDILEMARMNGTLSTINLPAILGSTRTYPGRQQGGYISDIAGSASGKSSGNTSGSNEAALLSIIQQNTVAMNKLNARLEKPIESKVALHGRGGLYEMMDEDSLLKDNANF